MLDQCKLTPSLHHSWTHPCCTLCKYIIKCYFFLLIVRHSHYFFYCYMNMTHKMFELSDFKWIDSLKQPLRTVVSMQQQKCFNPQSIKNDAYNNNPMLWQVIRFCAEARNFPPKGQQRSGGPGIHDATAASGNGNPQSSHLPSKGVGQHYPGPSSIGRYTEHQIPQSSPVATSPRTCEVCKPS